MAAFKIFVEVFLILHFTYGQDPSLFNIPQKSKKSASLKDIDQSLNKIVSVLTNISTSLNAHGQTLTCTTSLQDLGYATSDWKPTLSYTTGKQVTVTCDEGYKTKAGFTEQTVTCLPSGRWSPSYSCSTEVCPLPFKRYKSLCLYLDTTKRRWFEAKENCLKLDPERGSSLAMFQYMDKQRDLIEMLTSGKLVINNVPADSAWFGAQDLFKEGRYLWNDMSYLIPLFSEFSWKPREPNNASGREDCVVYSTVGTSGLDDVPCHDAQNSLCQIEI